MMICRSCHLNLIQTLFFFPFYTSSFLRHGVAVGMKDEHNRGRPRTSVVLANVIFGLVSVCVSKTSGKQNLMLLFVGS